MKVTNANRLRDMALQILTPSSEAKNWLNEAADQLDERDLLRSALDEINQHLKPCELENFCRCNWHISKRALDLKIKR